MTKKEYYLICDKFWEAIQEKGEHFRKFFKRTSSGKIFKIAEMTEEDKKKMIELEEKCGRSIEKLYKAFKEMSKLWEKID